MKCIHFLALHLHYLFSGVEARPALNAINKHFYPAIHLLPTNLAPVRRRSRTCWIPRAPAWSFTWSIQVQQAEIGGVLVSCILYARGLTGGAGSVMGGTVGRHISFTPEIDACVVISTTSSASHMTSPLDGLTIGARMKEELWRTTVSCGVMIGEASVCLPDRGHKLQSNFNAIRWLSIATIAPANRLRIWFSNSNKKKRTLTHMNKIKYAYGRCVEFCISWRYASQ